MAGLTFLDLPPEIRIAIYHYVLPPKDCYYTCVYAPVQDLTVPSEHDSFRRTCHQIQNEIEHEVVMSMPASIAGITHPKHQKKFLREVPPFGTGMLIKVPSTYAESRYPDITFKILDKFSACPIERVFDYFDNNHRRMMSPHMRALTIRLQTDLDERQYAKELSWCVSRTWRQLVNIAMFRQDRDFRTPNIPTQNIRMPAMRLIWSHSRDLIRTEESYTIQLGDLDFECWRCTKKAILGGIETNRLVWKKCRGDKRRRNKPMSRKERRKDVSGEWLDLYNLL
ncbi:hypothetical protein K491DRAFT_722828 [Lophiostoma macrostomum CBS 122681]|uniref:Uncharacterized protein n=1 Tax=Lophiostoma macrostomum CBS 122681 TaxID=1314788 RepID=A0A6A6SJT9_9PLEO|nr:hypothetical protein K491DRAFT_722828 [Lophiostoma macrostomum CBS 122681]